MLNSFSSEAMQPKKRRKKGNFPVEDHLISSSKGTKRKHTILQPEIVWHGTPPNIDYNYWNSISLSSRKPMRMNLQWQLRTSQGRHPYLIPGLLSSHPAMRYSTSQQIQLLQMVPHKLVRWSQLLLLGHFWTMFSQVSQQAVMLIAIYTFIYRLRDSWGDCFLQNKLKLCNNELLLWNFSYQPLMRNRFLLW